MKEEIQQIVELRKTMYLLDKIAHRVFEKLSTFDKSEAIAEMEKVDKTFFVPDGSEDKNKT